MALSPTDASASWDRRLASLFYPVSIFFSLKRSGRQRGDRGNLAFAETLAPIITKLVFPVSHRSLEIWPLRWRFVNGHAVAETYEALAHAWRKNSIPPR